jgi:uncharacterized protein (DUF736 family)
MAARIKGDFKMAIIGTFTIKGARYTGKIQTLSVNCMATMEPVEQKTPESPAFRVFAGKSEIGAAWEKNQQDGGSYLSVKLDDPSFSAPIFGALFGQEDGTFNLVWNRPKAA